MRLCQYYTSLTPVYPIVMSSTGTCSTVVKIPYEAQHNSSLNSTLGTRNNTGFFPQLTQHHSNTRILKAPSVKERSQQVDKENHEIEYNVKKLHRIKYTQ